MINSNELRIGNIVDAINKRHNEKYIIVESVNSGCINSDWRPYDFIQLIPIPLTPEVLFAAGFENFDNTWIVGRFSEWEVHLMKYGFVITHETCDPRIWNIPINTLHGVQNAIFALTGTELEIDLTKAIK